jgi:hypothetical protein
VGRNPQFQRAAELATILSLRRKMGHLLQPSVSGPQNVVICGLPPVTSQRGPVAIPSPPEVEHAFPSPRALLYLLASLEIDTQALGTASLAAALQLCFFEGSGVTERWLSQIRTIDKTSMSFTSRAAT